MRHSKAMYIGYISDKFAATTPYASLRARRIFANLLALVLLTFAVQSSAQSSQDIDALFGLSTAKNDRPLKQIAPKVLIRNVNILDGEGDLLRNTDILLSSGEIERIAVNIKEETNTIVVAGNGRWVTPGLIDLVHFPLDSSEVHGESAMAGDWSIERALPNLSAHHPYFQLAVASGITSVHLASRPSGVSAVLGVTVHTLADTTLDRMRWLNAPSLLSISCQAKHLAELKHVLLEESEANKDETLQLSAAKQVLLRAGRNAKNGFPIIFRCDSAEALIRALSLAKSYDLNVKAIDGLEAFKVAEIATNDGACGISVPSPRYRSQANQTREQQRDHTLLAPVIIDQASGRKGCSILRSNGSGEASLLPKMAGLAMSLAKAVNIDLAQQRVIRWLTYNPAVLLGIADRTGSIKRGKDADIVLWSKSPFSGYAKPDLVLVQGVIAYAAETDVIDTDFELGR